MCGESMAARSPLDLGFLTKGPAVFVMPLFFWLYLMLARKENYRVPIQHLLVACAVCIGIGLSWYVYVSQAVPGLADYFVGKQIVARVADDQAFDRAQPFWYYPLILVTTNPTLGLGLCSELVSSSSTTKIERTLKTNSALSTGCCCPSSFSLCPAQS